jgi:gamma-glutamylcyclotransferase (GGCT)/AIG2-like uncharacterized protein YtfP
MNKVFVYGTLQQEFGNHIWMENAGGVFLSKAVTVDNYPLIVNGLPYLMDEKGEGKRVHGEVYEVSDIIPLDHLEGHPSFYERRQREVELEDGSTLLVWMYFLNGRDWTNSDGKIYWSSYTEALGDREKSFSA